MLRLPEQFSPKYSAFFIYAVMLFFIITADGVMSYMVPVVMDHYLGSETLMGLILATSSGFGMFFDFFFSKQFPNKHSVFFNKILTATVILFPLSFFLFHTIPSFIFAMFIWGVYYEAMVFSNFHAIHEYVSPAQHLWAWGVLAMIKNIAWVIGPLLAATLDGRHPERAMYAAIAGYSIGIAFFLVRLVMNQIRGRKHHIKAAPLKHGFREEVVIWKVYVSSIWPLLILMLLFFLIDATFFTIGPVFAETLKIRHPLGNLFVSMYTIPLAIFIIATGLLARRFGKKRSAFLSGVFAGIGLIVMSRVTSVVGILFATFVASIGLGILYPELTAVFEDFVARAKKYGNDIIGLTAIMGSLGYVAGPIASGFLADHIGAQNVFGLLGLMLLTFSVCAFFLVKRKVRLPQKAAELKVMEVVEAEEREH